MVVWGTSDRCGRCMGYTGVVWGTSDRCGGCRGYTGVVWGTGQCFGWYRGYTGVIWGTGDWCGRCMGYTGVVWGTGSSKSTGAQQSLLQRTDGVKINDLCSDHNAYLDTSPCLLGLLGHPPGGVQDYDDEKHSNLAMQGKFTLGLWCTPP
ncbi:hypothetical protein C8F04DRAFT_1181534 [Mycena alexandri]|uniref:Uncharacterized protein n=1 Tax=Mycena alexandri TaxID=1745969 RepID=A0AAD6SYP9_9AGAR|nr:hypothetical protein C8F04DRAFT_1181534 [Mycena alexandri]